MATAIFLDLSSLVGSNSDYGEDGFQGSEMYQQMLNTLRINNYTNVYVYLPTLKSPESELVGAIEQKSFIKANGFEKFIDYLQGDNRKHPFYYDALEHLKVNSITVHAVMTPSDLQANTSIGSTWTQTILPVHRQIENGTITAENYKLHGHYTLSLETAIQTTEDTYEKAKLEQDGEHYLPVAAYKKFYAAAKAHGFDDFIIFGNQTDMGFMLTEISNQGLSVNTDNVENAGQLMQKSQDGKEILPILTPIALPSRSLIELDRKIREHQLFTELHGLATAIHHFKDENVRANASKIMNAVYDIVLNEREQSRRHWPFNNTSKAEDKLATGIEIIRRTTAILTFPDNRALLNQYMNYANDEVSGHPNHAWRIIGGVMIGLGILLIGISATVLALTNGLALIPGIVLAATGTVLIGAGAYTLYKNQAIGTAKIMDDLGDAIRKQRSFFGLGEGTYALNKNKTQAPETPKMIDDLNNAVSKPGLLFGMK